MIKLWPHTTVNGVTQPFPSSSPKLFHICICGSTHNTFDTDGLTLKDTPTNADMADYYNKLRYAACY